MTAVYCMHRVGHPPQFEPELPATVVMATLSAVTDILLHIMGEDGAFRNVSASKVTRTRACRRLRRTPLII